MQRVYYENLLARNYHWDSLVDEVEAVDRRWTITKIVFWQYVDWLNEQVYQLPVEEEELEIVTGAIN